MNRVRNLVLIAVLALQPSMSLIAMGACLFEDCCCGAECGCSDMSRNLAPNSLMPGSCSIPMEMSNPEIVLALVISKKTWDNCVQWDYALTDLSSVRRVVAAVLFENSAPPPQRRRHLVLSTFLI